jgi:hypothetical protein
MFAVFYPDQADQGPAAMRLIRVALVPETAKHAITRKGHLRLWFRRRGHADFTEFVDVSRN